MKLFVKRYIFPLIVAVILYTLVCLISNVNSSFLSFGLIISLLYALLIRIADDLKDYKRDSMENKIIFSEKTLIILFAFLLLFILFICIFCYCYLMILPIVPIFLSVFTKEKVTTALKPCFLPLIIIFIALSFFQINLGIIFFALFTVIIDVILICLRRENDHTK